MVVGHWYIVILIVRTKCCTVKGPLLHRLAVVLSEHGRAGFWNFNCVILVDVVRVKSYVNGLYNPTGVPV